MALTLGLILSYLAGSIPTAYLLGRLLQGIDIRKHGSGNVGATNAFRVLGPGVGGVVLGLDAFKGLAATVFIADFILKLNTGISPLALRILLGLAAVIGHSWTIFLNFKGGKGMAATLGVLIGLSIKFSLLRLILTAEILIWLIVFLFSRIVSLASIVSAAAFPILFIILQQPWPLIVMSLVLALLILTRHKSNISRLLRKQEPHLTSRAKK